MTSPRLPNLDEVALGAMLHDIGKFMQRAHGGPDALSREVRARESVILPVFDHRYSYWHALWSDAFFDWAARKAPRLRIGIDWDRVRDAAVFHHKPDKPWHWLAVEGDRLSAGIDRKKNDEQQESSPEERQRDAYRREPLISVLGTVSLGSGERKAEARHGVEESEIGGAFPSTELAELRREQPEAYKRLWPKFQAAFSELCDTAETPDALHEGLISLGERFLWAIPSSTIDQPDVSLHDHSRIAAAVAACLYRHHEARGELENEAAIKDRDRPKYRIAVGDLSGIQHGLFRLQRQQVKGVNRILRARSFLMGAVVDAAALLVRRDFGLPPYCTFVNAGGRFEMLLPELADAEARIEGLRARFDRWIGRRYLGELSLNLALTLPFSGKDLLRENFPKLRDVIAAAVENAKNMPLSRIEQGVLPAEYAAGADGACLACGVRPATMADGRDVLIRRCETCHDEHEIGSKLPDAAAMCWIESRDARHGDVGLFDGAALHIVARGEETGVPADRILSGFRFGGEPVPSIFAARRLASHVPKLRDEDFAAGRYADLGEEAKDVRVGDLKTFEHLAADAREILSDTRRAGRPYLAVLKADVDRLGQIFGHGLGKDRTIGRFAALSRAIDGFFTGHLDRLVRGSFPNTYTVYSGGDDVLLIGPWLDMIRLALRVQQDFCRFTGENPDLTLSAGIELIHAHEPLNRAHARAQARLDSAKAAGRDRVSVITSRPIGWPALADALKMSEEINDLIRADRIGTVFLYKVLAFDEDRTAAESGDRLALARANWRSRWAYHLSRQFDGMSDRREAERLKALFDGLLGGTLPLAGPRPAYDAGVPATLPVSIALYRNR